jgi:ribonuclease E
MKKEMLINVLQPEECRIAILEDGVLEELYVERSGHESYVGNIYKGRIVNIEPSIQAAFVDFGVGRNGFLHVSDVEPTYYKHLEQGRGPREERDRGERGPGDRRGNGRHRDRDRDRDRPRPQPAREEEELTANPAALDVEWEAAFPELPAIEERPADEAPAAREAKAEGGFAAGLPLEAGPEGAPATEPAAEEPPLPLVALPETQGEEDTGRPRRRSRGGQRRRKPAAEEGGAEAKAEGEAGEEPPKPRLMDSAERRTTEPDGGHDVSPLAEGPGSDIDEFLFFPSKPAPAARAEKEQPAEAERPEPPAAEAAPAAPPLAPERAVPPRRARPERGRQRSIEDDLAEDLAAAEIGEEEIAAPPYDLPAEREPAEEEPLGEPAADEGPERPFVADLDEDYVPRPQGRREGGDRRGGRDRGDRGDRRGGRRSNGRRPMGGRPGSGRPKPLIQDIFKRGQEVIVQVIKEGIGTKGPTLSTYISIAGRYLVLMPCLNRTGVSRKIADDEQRRRLRELFNELKPPRGLGFIMRTAAIDKQKKELQRDLVYLSRLWQVVARRIRKLKAPAEIYQESDMITRTIRDTFTSDIDTIWVDEPSAYEHAREFLEVVMPRYADRIKLYEATEPLFHKHGIEDEIARIQQKKIPLPMGGSIVIEQTEALVAIDVNSGNFRADRNDAEETAYQMNLQAAREIARQLRLRDLGGVIVNDFIDMRDDKHRRGVEKAMRDAVRRDRARTKVLKISQFGIIEMTRQRIRPSLKRSVYTDCPYCHGMAQVKTVESMSIEVMRLLQLAAHREPVARVEVTVTDAVADYLQNKKRREISKLEEEGQISVQVRGVQGAPPERMELVALDNNGNEVKLLAPEPVAYRPLR